MKALGFILIIAGILMFVFGQLSYIKKENLVDVGPLEINKEEKKTIDWPDYAGGIAVVAGIALLVVDNKKKYES
jgi:hypothetical protein